MHSILNLFFIIFFMKSNAFMKASDKPFILFTENKQYIRKANLSYENTPIKLNETEILFHVNYTLFGLKHINTGFIDGVDYSISSNLLLWNNEDSNIVSPLDKTRENTLGIDGDKALNKLTIYGNDARIAFDWIHDLLYWTDDTEIQVIPIRNTSLRYVVIERERSLIINIVIDPIESLIFWIEWDLYKHDNKIMRSYEDGSNITVIVDSGLRRLFAIALHLQTKTVYWIDRELHTLSSIDYNGNNRNLVLESEDLFFMSFQMDFFGDYIYWFSYRHDSVMKTHKSGLNRTAKLTVITSNKYIDSIKIVHPSRQPISRNRCLNSNCSHICLPNGINSFRCLCPSIKYYKFRAHEKCNTEEIRGISSITYELSYEKSSDSSSPFLTSLIVMTLIIQFAVLVFVFLKYINFDNSYFRRITRNG